MVAWFAALATVGCKPDASGPAAPPAKSAAASDSSGEEETKALDDFLKKDAPPPSQGLPAGHPPIAGGASPPAGEGGLAYDVPPAWASEPVTSSMRKAQFKLPRAAGDAEDGQLIVFYFGKNQGGGTGQNIDRWKAMFSTRDGQPVPDDQVTVRTLTVRGLSVTTLDISGNYRDPMMSHGQSAAAGSPSRMLAAVIETPEGPWFYKAVGPPATMESHRAAFNRFVGSTRMK